MLHPVGKLAPAVYWRRRLIFVGVPVVLLALLVFYVAGGDGSPQSARAGSPTQSVAKSIAPTTTSTTASAGSSSAAPATSTGPVAGRVCAAGDLRVQSATGKPSYAVNSRPDLYIVVTNVSTAACRQDLADPQIVLTITVGGARVWGSHDCGIEAGTDVTLLQPNAPVRRSIIWSGMTSQAGCAGTRLVSGAGTYALLATLAGKTSAPASFTLTASS